MRYTEGHYLVTSKFYCTTVQLKFTLVLLSTASASSASTAESTSSGHGLGSRRAKLRRDTFISCSSHSDLLTDSRLGVQLESRYVDVYWDAEGKDWDTVLTLNIHV